MIIYATATWEWGDLILLLLFVFLPLLLWAIPPYRKNTAKTVLLAGFTIGCSCLSLRSFGDEGFSVCPSVMEVGFLFFAALGALTGTIALCWNSNKWRCLIILPAILVMVLLPSTVKDLIELHAQAQNFKH